MHVDEMKWIISLPSLFKQDYEIFQEKLQIDWLLLIVYMGVGVHRITQWSGVGGTVAQYVCLDRLNGGVKLN